MKTCTAKLLTVASVALAGLPFSAASAFACGTGGYSYAGLSATSPAFGIAAHGHAAAAASTSSNGHVAGWVGVGGPGQGPNGTDEWLQVGSAAFPSSPATTCTTSWCCRTAAHLPPDRQRPPDGQAAASRRARDGRSSRTGGASGSTAPRSRTRSTADKPWPLGTDCDGRELGRRNGRHAATASSTASTAFRSPRRRAAAGGSSSAASRSTARRRASSGAPPTAHSLRRKATSPSARLRRSIPDHDRRAERRVPAAASSPSGSTRECSRATRPARAAAACSCHGSRRAAPRPLSQLRVGARLDGEHPEERVLVGDETRGDVVVTERRLHAGSPDCDGRLPHALTVPVEVDPARLAVDVDRPTVGAREAVSAGIQPIVPFGPHRDADLVPGAMIRARPSPPRRRSPGSGSHPETRSSS